MSDKELNTRTFCSLGIKNSSRMLQSLDCVKLQLFKEPHTPYSKGRRCYRNVSDRTWKDCSICSSNIADTFTGFLRYICIMHDPNSWACSSTFWAILCSFIRFNIKVPGYNWWRRYPSSSKVDFETTPYYSWYSWSFDGSLFKRVKLLDVFKIWGFWFLTKQIVF